MHGKSLVTGGSGFLGGHLVEALIARGDEVRVLVRHTSSSEQFKKYDIELLYGDLSHCSDLTNNIKNTDRIYHCAALCSDWGSWKAFQATNVEGLGNLLEAATRVGVRKFIHISTTDVYGHPGEMIDEQAPWRKRGWPYGDSKIEGERLVWKYYREKGLPITVIRPATIYGPRSVNLVLNLAILLKKRSMIFIGNGDTKAGLGYVTNIVDLILRAADTETSIGQAYNASDGSEITWRRFILGLSEILGVPGPRFTIPYHLAFLAGAFAEAGQRFMGKKTRPLLTRMAVELMGKNQDFSIQKAVKELAYQPRISFDEGMDHIKTWLHQAGLPAGTA